MRRDQFVIQFDEWIAPETGQATRAPRFIVHLGDEYLFPADVRMVDDVELQLSGVHESDLASALLRFGVTRLELGLRSGGVFPAEPTTDVQRIEITVDDLPFFRELLEEKRCDYQHRDGRDLLCAAAAKNDESVVGKIGYRFVAPTSRPLCAKCGMPDAGYACSHLVNPQVIALGYGGGSDRNLMGADCDRGREEIAQPGTCRADGHECWERVIPLVELRQRPEVSALALPEALDFLDAVWRVAMGRPLFNTRPMSHVAGLGLECHNREDFRTRMNDLADTLGGIEVADSLLPPAGGDADRQGTLNRLRTALRERLEEEVYPQVDDAIRTLQLILRVRVAFQHAGASSEAVGHFTALGLAYPPPDWGEAWHHVRSVVIDSVAIVRDGVRTLAR